MMFWLWQKKFVALHAALGQVDQRRSTSPCRQPPCDGAARTCGLRGRVDAEPADHDQLWDERLRNASSREPRRSDGLLSVLDTAGSPCAVLFGVCGGGGMCLQFATDHPDRTAGLILHNSMARVLRADDYPWGLPAELYERFLASFEEFWLDESDRIAARNPGLADDPRFRDWYAHYVRLASNPFMARRLAEMNTAVDNRPLLPVINCPSLVVTRTEDAWLSPENSRYLARNIPRAQLLELPGVDHDPWVGDTEPILQAVQEFLGSLDHPSASPTASRAKSRTAGASEST